MFYCRCFRSTAQHWFQGSASPNILIWSLLRSDLPLRDCHKQTRNGCSQFEVPSWSSWSGDQAGPYMSHRWAPVLLCSNKKKTTLLILQLHWKSPGSFKTWEKLRRLQVHEESAEPAVRLKARRLIAAWWICLGTTKSIQTQPCLLDWLQRKTSPFIHHASLWLLWGMVWAYGFLYVNPTHKHTHAHTLWKHMYGCLEVNFMHLHFKEWSDD